MVQTNAFSDTDAYHSRLQRVPVVDGERPQNVGILAMDMYFPSTFVSQEKLESFSNVSQGKFTIGLGQERMAFVNDREDVYSMSLSVVHSLMEKYDIDFSSVGRLAVATETLMDHSKSVKSVLMQLFEKYGNTDIEGIDGLHACYAGTDALFSSVAWCESSAWDGRFALVVIADIAEYAQGPARPTGGAGAVALLIGADAPIVLDSCARASHFQHAYDFYKPHLASPYPVVDGRFSNICYLRALDICYRSFAAKFDAKTSEVFDLNSADFTVFHAPYNKLVQKSFARLMYNDFLKFPDRPEFNEIQYLRNLPEERCYEDRDLQKAFAALSKTQYESKAAPACIAPKALGNMYTASLYGGLASLISTSCPANLSGKRILMFSYGSGLASSMFLLTVQNSAKSLFLLSKMSSALNIEKRLGQCVEQTPEVFAETLLLREKLHSNNDAYEPVGSTRYMFAGSYYLTHKDSKSRRFYQRVKG